MAAPTKPLVVPRCCVAMTVALEVVQEHRRKRAQAEATEDAFGTPKPKSRPSRKKRG